MSIVSVLELKSLLAKLEPEDRQSLEHIFLSEKPLKTNYIFEVLIGLLGFTYTFLRITQFAPTKFTIGEHLQIRGLTPECKMELKHSQYAIYTNLRKEELHFN